MNAATGPMSARARARRGWVIGSLVMAFFAAIFIVLAGSLLGVALAAIGSISGAVLGIPLLGDAARRDTLAPQPQTRRLVLAPLAVLVGMFLLPRFFDAIGQSLGWGLASGASGFLAAAGYVTSRSDEIFGSSNPSHGATQ